MDPALEAALQKKSLPALKKALAANPKLDELDSDGDSAMHVATKIKSHDLAEALLGAGASLDTKNADGLTPLYVLLKSKSGAMNALELANAAWLIEKGAGLNVPDGYGSTALHFAARSAPVTLLEKLVKAGALVSRNRGGNTPLFSCISTFFKDEKVWKLLLENGCSIDDLNAQGETLLHQAVSAHNPVATKYFVALGVNQAVKDAGGKTALDYATEYRNPKVLAALGR